MALEESLPTAASVQPTFELGQEVLDKDDKRLGKIRARFRNYVLVERGGVFVKAFYVPHSAIRDSSKDIILLSLSENDLKRQGLNRVPDNLYEDTPEPGRPDLSGRAQFARRPLSPAETGHYNYGKWWPGINTDASGSYHREEVLPRPQDYVQGEIFPTVLPPQRGPLNPPPEVKLPLCTSTNKRSKPSHYTDKAYRIYEVIYRQLVFSECEVTMDDNNTAAQVAAQASLMRVKYGTWVIISGLIAVMLVFIGTMIAFIVSQAILKPTASDVTAVVATVVNELGIITGAYFGVQIGAAGQESMQTERAVAISRGMSISATSPKPKDESIKAFKDAITKPSSPVIDLKSLFPGCLVPLIVVIVVPLVGVAVGLAASISQPAAPILATTLTVFAGTISTIIGVLTGIWIGNKLKKSAEEACTAVVNAVIDLAASIADARATYEIPPEVKQVFQEVLKDSAQFALVEYRERYETSAAKDREGEGVEEEEVQHESTAEEQERLKAQAQHESTAEKQERLKERTLKLKLQPRTQPNEPPKS